MTNDRDGEMIDPLTARIDALGGFRTYPPFSRLFSRLIIAWSWEAGDAARGLRDACLRFLEAELRYHQTLARLSERSAVSYEDLRSVADKRRIDLTALSEAIGATSAHGSQADVVKHLLLAEVHYHLRETPATVAELEAAIGGGGCHPLVFFALGYNRFDQARELFQLAQRAGPEETATFEREFRQACLSAADAFRTGLSGETFDAQLHYWIGRSLAAAGMTEEAEAALQTAVRIDPSILDRRLMLEDPTAEGGLEADSDAAFAVPEAGEDLPPISDEEIRMAAELLKRRWRVEEVLGIDR